MTLRYHRPQHADQHARRGFADYAQAPLPGLSVRGLRLSPGVPLYRASFEAALEGAVLESARLWAWRYFAFDEKRAVAGDVVRDDRPNFTHVFGGSTVHRTLDALSYAERLMADDETEVRLLTVPSVFVTAVWLPAEPPWLIVVRNGLRKMRPGTFADYVHQRAVARHEASERAREFERKRPR